MSYMLLVQLITLQTKMDIDSCDIKFVKSYFNKKSDKSDSGTLTCRLCKKDVKASYDKAMPHITVSQFFAHTLSHVSRTLPSPTIPHGTMHCTDCSAQ